MAAATEDNSIVAFLRGVKLDTMSKHSSVHTLKESQTVEDAVFLLAKHKIHSAPVLNKDGEVLGMVDMLDVVWSIVKVAPHPVDIQAHELQSLEIAGRAMAWDSLSKVVGSSGRDPLEPVFEHDPVAHALKIFATGVHRVPIVNSDQAVVNTVSHSALLGLVATKMVEGKMKDFVARPLGELGLGLDAELVTITAKDTVLKAAQQLKEGAVNALAVVDDKGALTGNFSASDLKELYKEKLPELTTAAGEYLAAHSPAALTPVTVNKKDVEAKPLADLIKLVVEKHVHRVWVVDDDNKPTSVISTSDICRVLANSPQQ